MEEPNTCPKPDCGRPESTHRYSAGKKLSICGNGHTWDQVAIAEQRAKAREAQAQEGRSKVFDDVRMGIDFDGLRRQFEKKFGPI